MAKKSNKTPMRLGVGSVRGNPNAYRLLRPYDRNRPIALSNPYLVAKQLQKKGLRIVQRG